jgi:hypothetical protein
MSMHFFPQFVIFHNDNRKHFIFIMPHKFCSAIKCSFCSMNFSYKLLVDFFTCNRYVHAELHGASSTIIKNHKRDTPIPPLTLNQAGCFTVSSRLTLNILLQ